MIKHRPSLTVPGTQWSDFRFSRFSQFVVIRYVSAASISSLLHPNLSRYYAPRTITFPILVLVSHILFLLSISQLTQVPVNSDTTKPSIEFRLLRHRTIFLVLLAALFLLKIVLECHKIINRINEYSKLTFKAKKIWDERKWTWERTWDGWCDAMRDYVHFYPICEAFWTCGCHPKPDIEHKSI